MSDPNGAPESWRARADRMNHKLDCRCVGCMRNRGEKFSTGKRPKTSRQRGYVWLSDVVDQQLREEVLAQGVTLTHLTRKYICEGLERDQAARAGIADVVSTSAVELSDLFK